jgi:hypothetical protein
MAVAGGLPMRQAIEVRLTSPIINQAGVGLRGFIIRVSSENRFPESQS